MYFWTIIRKNRPKYTLTRGISEEDVPAILLHDVIVAKDLQKAEASLLKLAGLRKYIDGLKTDGEKESFKRHLSKYINIWLPECSFEVSTTNRYTVVTHEAAITARRFIKKNETIKYLCGCLVSMTEEEEKDLDLTRRDFSIVMSSRKKTPSLFLGPARFANHDCNANARLVTQGTDGMQVVAVREIQVGEEITVTYGDSYFGEGNCECLCLTCEKEGRNGWPPRVPSVGSSGTATPFAESELDATRPYSFRRTRKHAQITGSPMLATPETDRGSPRKRRKVSDIRSPSSLSLGFTDGQVEGTAIKTEPSKSALRHEFLSVGSIANPSPESSNLEQKMGPPSLEINIRTKTIHEEIRSSVQAAFAIEQERSFQQTQRDRQSSVNAALQPEIDVKTSEVRGKAPTLLNTPDQTPSGLQTPSAPSDVVSIFDRGIVNSSSITTPSASLEVNEIWKAAIAVSDQGSASDSELSDLSDAEDFDDVNHVIIRTFKPRPRRAKKSKIIPTIEIEKPITTRVPGDYIRTSLLLGESYSRWVDCRTCAGCWVQPNGYLTRKECPRCERHSKLYGYQWPKTEKTGRRDPEERVMDHRTVHRFVRPEEEALVKKRGRGVEKVEDNIHTERRPSSGLEGEKGSTGRRGRGSGVGT